MNFLYDVDIEHSPHFGFSTAYYRGHILAQCELGRIVEPLGDDDKEWEMYEERYSEWRDEILTNLKRICAEVLTSKELKR